MKRLSFSTGFSNRVLTPSLAAIALTGLMALMAQPAKADDLLEDAAIGAGVGLGTGLLLGDDFGLDDAANGAAAGVACNLVNEEFRDGGDRNLLEDLAVGAVAAGGVGLITNDDSFIENAAQGAAACGVINVLD
ncbi:MAG: hypothetical protein AAFP20_19330 [Cyanobacteria bacterium J06614_10]